MEAVAPASRAERPRNGLRRAARIAGILFVLAAFAVGGYVAWTLWGTGLATQRWQDRLRPGLERRIHAAAETPKPPPATITHVPGDAVAILKIPQIHLDMVVVEGTDTLALERGPGHYTGTAYPWQNHGRVAIAGHRTTYLHPFYSLDAVRKGDPIVLLTEYGTFRYEVTGTYVTLPDGILPGGQYVLDQTRSPTLALTTCNPRYSASQRLIVIAKRVATR
ncbi:MAG: sortase [Actinomycetota bacterium]